MAPKAPRRKFAGTGYGTGGGGEFGFTADQQAAMITGLTGAAPATNSYRRVARDQRTAESQFGSSLRASIKKQFVGARATAQMDAVITAIKKDELDLSGKTVAQMATIMKGGAQAQAMAAAAAKARAVQAATGASDSQTAAFAMDLAKMKYAADLEAQAAERAQAQAEAQAIEAHGAQMGPIIQGLSTNAPLISETIAQAVNEAVAENDGTYKGLNATQIATDVLTANGWDQDAGAVAYAGALASTMIGRQWGASKAVPQAMKVAFGGQPGYEDWGAPVASNIIAKSQKALAERYMDPGYQGGSEGGTDENLLGMTYVGGTQEGSIYENSRGERFTYNPLTQTYDRIG